jgi:hypothetical protein
MDVEALQTVAGLCVDDVITLGVIPKLSELLHSQVSFREFSVSQFFSVQRRMNFHCCSPQDLMISHILK